MELANLWSRTPDDYGDVRVAARADASAIMNLLGTAAYTHYHVDWYLPGDWLGSSGFVVQPESESPARGSVTARLLGTRPRLRACLAAAADPLPAAWVRVVAIAGVARPRDSLAAMMELAVANLRRQGVTELAWLAVEEWPNSWLPELGFIRTNQIETYIKEDKAIPPVNPVPGLHIRQVLDSDMEALARLEAAAFQPLWRHSAHALAIARGQTLSFDVALLDDEIVGFQLSASSNSGAHLVRMTVSPERQQMGIGSALLARTLEGYYRRGLTHVSLNTQVDNTASQRLYRKFGFRASRQRLPVWTREL
ncbi:MAG TPA: GNAT family N-acetyltransferase [Anaerolineae bacterium]